MSGPSPNHPTVNSGPTLQPRALVAGAEPAVHAAIDIGTNSVHLVVARGTAEGRFEVVAQEKEVVRLGHGTGDMTHLDPDAIDRGIAALDRFRQVADIWEAQITAVATSAVREAENHDVFIRRARAEAGINVEMISGVEEARLIHLGVLHALPVYDQQRVVIDIGGGSTEVVVGRHDQILEARSLKLGAIRLTDRFFDTDQIKPRQVKECRRHVRAFIEPTARDIVGHGFDTAVGSSGTIQTLAAMALAARGDGPGRSLNNVVITAAELATAIDHVVSTPSTAERMRLPGMDARRADIIVGGAIILEQLVEALHIDELRISSFALREGVLLDRFTNAPSMDHLANLRRASVLHLAEGLDPEREHSEHVTELALKLFDQLDDIHGLDDHHRELLEAAGLLHNVGLFVNHSGHHKHSYYLIRNSEQMLGFTDHEIELIALVARYHRKSEPKPKHPELEGVSDDDRRAVALLAGILRIAIGLDRTYSSVVTGVECHLDADRQLTIVPAVVEGADASLEIYAATERQGLLSDTLELDIDIHTSVAPQVPMG